MALPSHRTVVVVTQPQHEQFYRPLLADIRAPRSGSA
jgi:hypothetical protein